MFTNYIKIAWKVLLRHPFYTFITLFGISLTLTVLMVITSFLDHLIGSHYPENRRNRLLYIQMISLSDSLQQSHNKSPGSYEFMQRYVKTLKTPEAVGLTTLFEFANTYVNNKRIELRIKHTDAQFWTVTDFDFVEGKPYDEQSLKRGDNVMVITDNLKKQYFGETDQPVVGKYLTLDSRDFRIIGVVRGVPVTRPVTSADLYLPATATHRPDLSKGFSGGYSALILARDPADMSTIQAEYDQAIRQIPLPNESNGFRFSIIETGAETYLGTWLRNFFDRSVSGIFYAVVGLFMLLFMALPAINLVNLNVSRIMERASEIGIRKAFGAPVRTLVGQFIVENLFITFIGGAIALMLSTLIIAYINQSGWIARADLTLNLTVFAVSILICLIFGLLSGVAPAFRMSRLPIADALKV
ncbi:ABC transporter permease [Spirosoma sordidisoli]|uniref:ABC transporter permease n=1 Tax=Spirosoma sordidisoli TaxID=2502893 RepID=A0A4Q2UV75_9BACT|nr:ABC transporter permease [Spirosoma sordidisoli]RYC71901.1 ABC transporter permease [Spirosoma sordidisoli]